MENPRDHRIETVAQLQALIGDPNPMTPKKLFSALDETAIDFVERSPLLCSELPTLKATKTLHPKATVWASSLSKTSTRF